MLDRLAKVIGKARRRAKKKPDGAPTVVETVVSAASDDGGPLSTAVVRARDAFGALHNRANRLREFTRTQDYQRVMAQLQQARSVQQSQLAGQGMIGANPLGQGMAIGGGSVISTFAPTSVSVDNISSAVALTSAFEGRRWASMQTMAMPEIMPGDQLVVTYDWHGRMHNAEGPAVRSASTIVIEKGARTPIVQHWFWHGVNVDERIVKRPETITIAEIDAANNVELRRVLIERYGQERFFRDCGAILIQQDECGELYVRPFRHDPRAFFALGNAPRDPWGIDSIVFVKVTNSTPEGDGTFKSYYLRVPPETQTAREGVAWTFGLPEDAYRPLVQT